MFATRVTRTGHIAMFQLYMFQKFPLQVLTSMHCSGSTNHSLGTRAQHTATTARLITTLYNNYYNSMFFVAACTEMRWWSIAPRLMGLTWQRTFLVVLLHGAKEPTALTCLDSPRYFAIRLTWLQLFDGLQPQPLSSQKLFCINRVAHESGLPCPQTPHLDLSQWLW